jgi:hypothetical protein
MLGGADSVNIYGNLFFCSTNCGFGGNGTIATWSDDSYRNNAIHIFNNSFINLFGGYGPKIYFTHNSADDTDIEAKNNLYYNADFDWTGVDTQSNEACGGGQPCQGSNAQTGLLPSIFVQYSNDNFRLNSPTEPGDASIGAQFKMDMNGATRGSDGLWDRGAYEY